jgi:Interleukin-like EMT inducer
VVNTPSIGDYAGFYLVELNVSSCLSTNIRRFNTHLRTTDSDNMAIYINSLPLNTVLIGVTADAIQYYLTQNAKDALFNIGVDLNSFDYYGKLIFVSQIGQPDMSVSQKAPGGGSSLNMTINVAGIWWSCLYTAHILRFI